MIPSARECLIQNKLCPLSDPMLFSGELQFSTTLTRVSIQRAARTSDLLLCLLVVRCQNRIRRSGQSQAFLNRHFFRLSRENEFPGNLLPEILPLKFKLRGRESRTVLNTQKLSGASRNNCWRPMLVARVGSVSIPVHSSTTSTHGAASKCARITDGLSNRTHGCVVSGARCTSEWNGW